MNKVNLNSEWIPMKKRWGQDEGLGSKMKGWQKMKGWGQDEGLEIDFGIWTGVGSRETT